MRLRAAITFAIAGQTLLHRAMQGRPSSGTFAVHRINADDDYTAEFSGACTVDTVNTTVNVASGPSKADPQRIDLASTVGITAARKYLLSDLGKLEWVEPVEIASDHIRVRHPLENDYTTAATFVGATLSAAVDTTWVSNKNNVTWFSNTWYDRGRFGVAIGDPNDPFPGYRVLWTFVVGGVTYTEYSFFDVVRAPVAHHVDIDDINGRAPGLKDSIPTEYRVEDGRPLIDSAWRAVRAQLASVKIDVQSVQDDEVIDELVILRSLQLLAEAGWKPAGWDIANYLVLTTKNFDRFFEQHLQVVTRVRVAAGAGGAATLPEPLPFFRK